MLAARPGVLPGTRFGSVVSRIERFAAAIVAILLGDSISKPCPTAMARIPDTIVGARRARCTPTQQPRIQFF